MMNKARIVVLTIGITSILATVLFPYTEYYVDAGSQGVSCGFVHISIAPRKGFIPIWEKRHGVSTTHVQWPVVFVQAGGIVIVCGIALALVGKGKRPALGLPS